MTNLNPLPRSPVASERVLTSHSGSMAGFRKSAKAASDFEALAIGILLQPIFDSVDTAHGILGGGPGEGAWRPIFVQELSRNVAAKGGLGFAKPIYDAMIRTQKSR